MKISVFWVVALCSLVDVSLLSTHTEDSENEQECAARTHQTTPLLYTLVPYTTLFRSEAV
jgi:hypothetical protein